MSPACRQYHAADGQAAQAAAAMTNCHRWSLAPKPHQSASAVGPHLETPRVDIIND